MLKNFPLWIFVWSIAATFSSCGSVMKSMVGQHNIASVNLARECQMDTALTVVRQSQEHHSEVNKAQGLLLEIVYLRDLGRDAEAKALFPKLIKVSPWVDDEKGVERDAKKAIRDLRKMRKRRGYDKDCADV